MIDLELLLLTPPAGELKAVSKKKKGRGIFSIQIDTIQDTGITDIPSLILRYITGSWKMSDT